jgi:hypothetical protein
MKDYLADLVGFSQGNVHVKVEHQDSSVKSLEVSSKGSLGLAWSDLVKVVRLQSSRWGSVSRLERWVCRKADVFRDL